MIHIHTSQTSKNSCSIVISHPYYTSFTPTYIVVVIVVTVAVVTVITHYIHPYYNCLPNLVHQSIIPTCTAISHPYLHTYIVVVIVVTVVVVTHSCCCCCSCCSEWLSLCNIPLLTMSQQSIKPFCKTNLPSLLQSTFPI